MDDFAFIQSQHMQLWSYKFCKAIVKAVLHHFCVPVTLQSQNVIIVNKPIKIMVNFQKKFPTSVRKVLIC